MKKRNIAAAVILSAVIGGASLAACSGGCSTNKQGHFNLDDYVVSLDISAADGVNFAKSGNFVPGYGKAVKTEFTAIQKLGSAFAALAKATKSDGTLSLYDAENQKELFSGLSALEVKTQGSVEYYEMHAGETYKYAGPDGKLMTDKEFSAPGLFSLTSDGTGEINGRTAEIFVAAYPTNEAEPDQKTKIYFAKYSSPAEWECVEQSAVDRGGYAAGDYLSPERHVIYNSAYVDCALKDYTYTVENTPGSGSQIYTFYGSGGKTGSVVLYSDCRKIAFVGEYLYYYSFDAVREDSSKHYNCEVVLPTGVYKFNYVLYRYNFVNGKSDEIATDYVIMDEGFPLYNYSENSYDKFYATAYLMQDKIAVIDQDSNTSRIYKIVFDEDMAICADYSASALDLSKPVYKLGDGRYLSGNNICDGNLRTVASLSGDLSVWAEEELIICDGSTGRMFVDYDAKVVIPSVPSVYKAYGSSVYAGNMVYNRQNPAGIAVDKLVAAAEGETTAYSDGVIYKRTSDGGVYTFELYDLQGKKFGSIDKVAEDTLSFVKIGSDLYFTGTTGEEGNGKAVWIITG